MFDELFEKIDQALAKIQEQETPNKDLVSFAEILKDGLASVSDKIGEMEDSMDNKALALKILTAWKDQLAKAGLVEDVDITEDFEVESLLKAFATVAIPTVEEVQAELNTVKVEKEALEAQIADAELTAKTIVRLTELTEANVVIPEALKEKTEAKVRNMTDEEFEEFKSEQIAFLEANKTVASEEDETEEVEETEEEDANPQESFASRSSYNRRLVVDNINEDNIDFGSLFGTSEKE